MMRFRVAIGALAAALVSSAAFAQAPGKGARIAGQGRGGNPGEFLQRADTNHDGKVSFEELKAVRPQMTRERFNMLDRNHDGFISPADRPSGGGKAGGPAAAAGEPDARSEMLKAVMAADADHDGKVSFHEIEAAKPGFSKADFDRLDRDHDGFITGKDAPPAAQAGANPLQVGGGRGGAAMTPEARKAIRERLRAADKDGDGYVSRAEAKVAMPGLTDQQFNALDRNGDGKIGPGDRPERGAKPRTKL